MSTDRPTDPRPLRRWLKLAVLAVLVAAAATGHVLWDRYQQFRDAPLSFGSEERVLLVAPGDSFREVLRKIRRLGIRSGHDLQWQALAWDIDVIRRLQVGEYAVGQGISPRQLLEKLASGRVIQHRFTIVEGWTVAQLRAALAAEQAVVQTLQGVDAASLMARLGAEGVPAEGRFLPETYQFTRGTEDIAILRRAFLAMQRVLDEEWSQRADGLPLDSPEQALVLASIIEKETGRASERAQIAGVFVRRLQLGMKLQTDPTVIYGLGDAFAGNLTRAHLRTDTPFNTYVRFGLPPTPIALPGRDAIHAALHPAEGDALYFVSRGDGSHVFSSSLREHNRAVRRYQLGTRR